MQRISPYWKNRDLLAVILLTLLGALLRLYQIGSVPPGFQFDEAFNAIDAQQVLAGNRPLFLPANDGREALYTYWQAGVAAFFGLNVFALRLASALVGIATLPATYWLVRSLFSTQSRALAIFTTATLALSMWHIHFSHFGIRVILMPLIFSGLFGCAWLGYHAATPRRRLLAFVAAGICAGLGVWSHPTGRLAPLVLIAFAAWLHGRAPWRRTRAWDSPLGGLVIMGVAAFLVFLPLGLEFYRHPGFFLNHPGGVFIFNPEATDESGLAALWQNGIGILGMFSFVGDHDWFYNLAHRPVFDPLMSVAFYLGVMLMVRKLFVSRRPAATQPQHAGRDTDPQADDPQAEDPQADANAIALIGLWGLVMLLPSLLSEDAPNFSRTLPALPALFVACGFGLARLYRIRHPWPILGPVLAGVIVLYSGAQASYDYFVRFASHERVYYAFDQDKLDALAFLEPFTADHRVYLAPLWANAHATVYHLRGPLGISSLDTTHTLVLPPPGQGAVYAFPAEQTDRAAELAAYWDDAVVQRATDRLGGHLLSYVQLDAAAVADWPPHLQPTQSADSSFVGAPRLLGLRAGDPAGDLWLYWHAEETMWSNLTAFVHLEDADGRRVAQIDKLPGNGSYPTPAWRVGERVIDRFIPERLEPCAEAAEMRVRTGWYALADNVMQPIARADAPGNRAFAGTLRYRQSYYRAGELTPPQPHTVTFNPALTLRGYELDAVAREPHTPLVLDLYWQSQNATAALLVTPLELWLQPATTSSDENASDENVSDEPRLLWQESLAAISADDAPTEDSALDFCRRIRVPIPADVPPGAYDLILRDATSGTSGTQGTSGTSGTSSTSSAAGTAPALDGATPLATLDIVPSTRRFSPPDLHTTIAAQLTDLARAPSPDAVSVTLLGHVHAPGLEPDARGLAVQLAWQAQAPDLGNYRVFVHLLDSTDTIVTQNDTIPGGARPTEQWIAGEVVLDSHALPLPADLPSGVYRLVAGLYDPLSGDRLQATGPDGATYPMDAIPIAAFDWTQGVRP